MQRTLGQTYYRKNSTSRRKKSRKRATSSNITSKNNSKEEVSILNNYYINHVNIETLQNRIAAAELERHRRKTKNKTGSKIRKGAHTTTNKWKKNKNGREDNTASKSFLDKLIRLNNSKSGDIEHEGRS